MQRTIRIQLQTPYSLHQVWRALTESYMLGQWFMQNDFQPVLHREFTFRMAPQKGWDGITHCKVIELQSEKSLAFTYCGSATGEKVLACADIHSKAADAVGKGLFAELDTVLRFSLIRVQEGTCLTLEHSGFKGFKMVIVSLVMGMGWKKQLFKKLPKVLAEIAREEKAWA